MQMWTTSMSGDTTSASPSSKAVSAPRRSTACLALAGVDAATPTSRAPARRAALAWTAPMKPAPTTPTRNADRPESPEVVPPRRHPRELLSKVNRKFAINGLGTNRLLLFDTPKMCWFTVDVDVGAGRRQPARRRHRGDDPRPRPQRPCHDPRRPGDPDRSRPLDDHPAGGRPARPPAPRPRRRPGVDRRAAAGDARLQQGRRRGARRRHGRHPLPGGGHRPRRTRARRARPRHRHRRRARSGAVVARAGLRRTAW